MAHGTQSCHVERTTHHPTPAVDAPAAVLSPAVTIVRGDARQGGRSLWRQFSEFRHFCQHGGGDHRTDPGNGLEAFGFARQFRVLGDQGGNGLITLGDLFFQGFAELPRLAEAEGIGVMFGMVAFHGEHREELAAALGEVGQLLLLGRGRSGGAGLKGRAVGGEHGGVNRIGLGALALRAGEVADAPGFHDADREVRRLKDPDQWLFIATRGFTNDVRGGMNAQEFEELGVAFGVIGQEVKPAGQMELQRELGNVEADVKDVGVVLTHTCGYELR